MARRIHQKNLSANVHIPRIGLDARNLAQGASGLMNQVSRANRVVRQAECRVGKTQILMVESIEHFPPEFDNCCKSRPAKGRLWMMSGCKVLLKLLASVWSIGNSAFTVTFSLNDPTFNLASTRITWAAGTLIAVMSSIANPLAAKLAR